MHVSGVLWKTDSNKLHSDEASLHDARQSPSCILSSVAPIPIPVSDMARIGTKMMVSVSADIKWYGPIPFTDPGGN